MVKEGYVVMKIGLLSMHRVVNYGSFWQANCLKEMISDIGNCDVEFIDIIPGKIEERTEYKKSFSFSKIKRIPYYLFQKKKNLMFKEYQSKVLGCYDELNYRSDYDTIIIGSDEVFNFVQKSPWGFSKQLYGDIENNNVNTYAACFGYTTLEDIISREKKDEIIKGLNNLKNVSVRDQNSHEIIKTLINQDALIHLDPVLVGEFPDILPEAKMKDYILVYSYDFRLSDHEIIESVRSFAKKNKKKIISVGFYQDWVDENILPTPLEIISYFRNADYVVTDTFHGTIFSARTHKKFLSIIRETNKQKLGDLLERIGMKDREYSIGDNFEKIIIKDIDYDNFERIRTKEKNRSIEYLKRCLSRSL